MSDLCDPYAEIPYEGGSYPPSHPDNLAVIATLFGMRPKGLEEARVLEIGCAVGGNLLPLAVAYPGSRFVGIDLSPRQIAEANEAVAALSLANVSFLAMGLEEVGTTMEPFDYIIAHGVYSWVAAPVRDQLMALCSRLLSPGGVAYISFNTLPGGGTRAALREMAKFHTKGALDEADRMKRSREFFAFLEGALKDRQDAYAQSLSEELATLAQLGDFYIRHEHLEETNEPFYFHEFISHAQRHGLQFLAEAEIRSMSAAGFPVAVRKSLREMSGSVEESEQYGDFVRNRAFRQTLLCRAGTELKRAIAPGLLQKFHVASGLDPVPGEPGEVAWFRDADGVGIEVRDALTVAALLELRTVWPAALPFDELLVRVSARAGAALDARQAATLAGGLLTCYSTSRELEFQKHPRPFRTSVSDFPRASPLVRWQAGRGLKVTNLRHESGLLRPEEQALLLKLDGSRGRTELEAENPGARKLLEHLAGMAMLVD